MQQLNTGGDGQAFRERGILVMDFQNDYKVPGAENWSLSKYSLYGIETTQCSDTCVTF